MSLGIHLGTKPQEVPPDRGKSARNIGIASYIGSMVRDRALFPVLFTVFDVGFGFPLRALVALADRLGEGDVAGFQVELEFGRRAEDARAFVVEFSFPACDHNCRQTISHEVDG